MSRLEEEELDSKSLMPAESNDRGFKDQIKDDPGPGVVTEAQESEVAAGGQSHHKDKKKSQVFFLGDSYSPVNVGGDIDCKVIRIDSGDFSQFKKLLLGLVKEGFEFGVGSLFVTCLMSHLVRLGSTGYITELAEFEDWVKVNLRGEVIPAINPFEEDLPVEWKITFNQFWSFLVYKDVRAGSQPDNVNFLWGALKTTMEKYGTKGDLPFLNFSFKHQGQTVTIGREEGGGEEQSFLGLKKGVEGRAEESFLTGVLEAVRGFCNDTSRGNGLVLPPAKEVIKGVLKKKLSAEEEEFFKNKMVELEGGFRKIFVMGSSIIKNAVPVVESESAKIRGVSVVNLARGGAKIGDLGEIISTNKDSLDDSRADDICVISCLGNELIVSGEGDGVERNLTKCNKVWLVPRLVTKGDDGTEVLISKLEVVIDQVLGFFKGNIKFFGPWPRHRTRTLLQQQGALGNVGDRQPGGHGSFCKGIQHKTRRKGASLLK